MSSGVTIEIPDGHGGTLRAYLATPRQGSGPGVILLQDSAEITPHLRACADRHAEEGYVVLVPVFTSEDAPITTTTLSSARELDDVLPALGSAIAALRAQPAQVGGIGLVGFGVGGQLACLAAQRYDVDCVAAYYPSTLAHEQTTLEAVRCPTVLHLAERDERLSATTRARWLELALGYPSLQIHHYPGVDSGFVDALHSAYDKPAAMMAYSRTLALLRSVLGPIYDLSSLWDKHTEYEFATRDVDATMSTMVDEPYVNHVPTMTGGVGHAHLKRFYRYHFVNANPPDTRLIPVSRTVGVDRLVDEMVFCFTHTCEIPWMLPGLEPSGRYVEIPLVAIVNFRGDKLYHEHIYWDQASVLVQIGALDPSGLPVAGIATARKLLDEQLPSNELMGQRWIASAEQPL